MLATGLLSTAVALIQVFAFLAETLLYRANRVPVRARAQQFEREPMIAVAGVAIEGVGGVEFADEQVGEPVAAHVADRREHRFGLAIGCQGDRLPRRDKIEKR